MTHANPNLELVYRVVAAYIAEHGVPPSQREIADGCQLSRSSVQYLLAQLAAQGRIKLKPGRHRGLKLK